MYKMLVDGDMLGGTGETPIIDPALGQMFAQSPTAGLALTDAAVQAAATAFIEWRSVPPLVRGLAVCSIADALDWHAPELATLLVRETGKPMSLAREEVRTTAAMMRDLTQISLVDRKLQSDVTLRHRPLGVVGVISPWNAPLKLAMQPVAAALYAGNAVVVKPSPYAPLTVLVACTFARDLLPSGVLNVVVGDERVGEYLVRHDRVDKISFTGSTTTGKRIMAAASGDLKRLTLELGGNDAAIVMDDADVETIVDHIFNSAFVNSGQVCMAIKRLYVQRPIYQSMVDALESKLGDVVLGSGMDPATTMGPIQNRVQYDRVLYLIYGAMLAGAKIISRQPIPDAYESGGYFLSPSIVLDCPSHIPLTTTEQFGPVLPVYSFEDEAEAVRRANYTNYGLCGSVWSSDVERATALAAQLEVGTALVNQHWITTNAMIPFGGAKQSGIGRNYGEIGLYGYTEPQVISVRTR